MISETAQSQVQIDNPKICFPFIHLNGNDGNKLANQYLDALNAFDVFVEKFQAIEFHSRDYYPKGDGSWPMAVKEYQSIMRKGSDIRQFLELHAAHCFEAAR